MDVKFSPILQAVEVSVGEIESFVHVKVAVVVEAIQYFGPPRVDEWVVIIAIVEIVIEITVIVHIWYQGVTLVNYDLLPI